MWKKVRLVARTFRLRGNWYTRSFCLQIMSFTIEFTPSNPVNTRLKLNVVRRLKAINLLLFIEIYCYLLLLNLLFILLIYCLYYENIVQWKNEGLFGECNNSWITFEALFGESLQNNAQRFPFLQAYLLIKHTNFCLKNNYWFLMFFY